MSKNRLKIRPGGKVQTAKVERHPVEVAQETVILTDFVRNGEIVPAFSFATAEGRGTSPEIVPFDELPQYVARLRLAESDGVPRREVAEDAKVYVPTYTILDAELRLGNHSTVVKNGKDVVKGPDGKPLMNDHGDRIFLRSRDGRGAKTQKIRQEHFSEFVDFVDALQDEREDMMEHWNEALPGLLEARATALAAAEAEEAAAVAAAATAAGTAATVTSDTGEDTGDGGTVDTSETGGTDEG